MNNKNVVRKVKKVIKMSECSGNCSSCSSNCDSRKPSRDQFWVPANKDSNIKKIIGVVSGKGGVGKSFVTSYLSVLLNRKGYKTAILDADVRHLVSTEW